MDFKEKFKQDLINEDVHLSLTSEQRESIADLMDYQLRLYLVTHQRALLKAFYTYCSGFYMNAEHYADTRIDNFIKSL